MKIIQKILVSVGVHIARIDLNLGATKFVAAVSLRGNVYASHATFGMAVAGKRVFADGARFGIARAGGS